VDETDPIVVIAGAGMAGICAAAAAAESGARVVVVEKAEQVGGTARLSGGLVWTDGTYEDFRARNPRGDADLGRVLVDRYQDTVAWLAAGGTEFGPRMTGLFGSGVGQRILPDMPTFFGQMEQRVRRAGAEVRYGTAVHDVVLDASGTLEAVRLRTPLGFETQPADALVLATGGFAANPEMLTRYVGRYADRLHLRAHPLNTGDGIDAGLRAGAATSRAMHGFYGHLLPAPPLEPQPARLVELTQYYSIHALLVNRDGKRFVDETEGDELSAQALAAQPDALGFLLVDHGLSTEVIAPAVEGFPETERLAVIEELGGRVLRASTLDELARQIDAAGGNGWRTVQTLAEYNEVVGVHPERLPVRRRIRRRPLVEPPFVAVPVTPGITMTQGGLKIDTAARVLDRRGAPIPGLFAAGSDGGGVYHENYAGGLSMSSVFGRIAGTGAAEASARRGQRTPQAEPLATGRR